MLFGVGKDKLGRKMVMFKGEAVPGKQIGIYFDALLLLLVCDTATVTYVFWMIGDETGKGKGHGISVEKGAEDLKTSDPLAEWKVTLLEHGFPMDKLHQVGSLEQVSPTLQQAIGCTVEMGDQVANYLKRLAK